MDPSVLDDLFPAEGQEPPPVTFGKVTATSPLTIQFNGTAPADAVSGPLALSTYSPTVGDNVVLLKVGPAYVALGAV